MNKVNILSSPIWVEAKNTIGYYCLENKLSCNFEYLQKTDKNLIKEVFKLRNKTLLLSEVAKKIERELSGLILNKEV